MTVTIAPKTSERIRCTEVGKSLGARQVVKAASFSAKAGEITTILGPSGCGKTTLLRLVAGLLKPQGGRAEISPDGSWWAAPSSYPQAVGMVMQENALFEELSIRENADYFAALRGLGGAPLEQRKAKLVEKLGLGQCAGQWVSRLSGGQRKRANILCSLLHEPQIVLMDEPTVGLDPMTRKIIWNLLVSLKRENKCVIFTTHNLQEAEALSDSIVIMNEGQIAVQGTLGELKKIVGGDEVVKLSSRPGDPAVMDGLSFELDKHAEVEGVAYTGGVMTIKTTNAHWVERFVSSFLKKTPEYIEELQVKEPTLDDIFSIITGKRGLEIAEKRQYG